MFRPFDSGSLNMPTDTVLSAVWELAAFKDTCINPLIFQIFCLIMPIKLFFLKLGNHWNIEGLKTT